MKRGKAFSQKTTGDPLINALREFLGLSPLGADLKKSTNPTPHELPWGIPTPKSDKS